MHKSKKAPQPSTHQRPIYPYGELYTEPLKVGLNTIHRPFVGKTFFFTANIEGLTEKYEDPGALYKAHYKDLTHPRTPVKVGFTAENEGIARQTSFRGQGQYIGSMKPSVKALLHFISKIAVSGECVTHRGFAEGQTDFLAESVEMLTYFKKTDA